MKILLVTQYFHPEPFRVNDLVAGLRDRGHVITVLTGMPNYPDGHYYKGYSWYGPLRDSYAGSPVLRAPMISRGREKNWRLALNFFSFAISATLLGPLRCRDHFDLILVFQPSPVTVGLPALLLGYLKRAPVALWIQDLWPDTLAAVGQGKLANRVGGWLADFVHRRCKLLLIQSPAFRPRLIARGIRPDSIRYLPNWAEDLYFESGNATAADAVTSHKGFRILFAGNLGSAQSLETILAAAELTRSRKDIRWLMVGDGILRSWLEQEIRSRNLSDTVALLGRHPVESMPAFFAGADALLVTLADDPVFALTIPSKIQSYMAAGRPVIGALNGEGARIISESGCGLVCGAGDARALANLVQDMADMPPAERLKMGECGQDYFETHFERKLLLDRLEGWMKELTERQLCAS